MIEIRELQTVRRREFPHSINARVTVLQHRLPARRSASGVTTCKEYVYSPSADHITLIRTKHIARKRLQQRPKPPRPICLGRPPGGPAGSCPSRTARGRIRSMCFADTHRDSSPNYPGCSRIRENSDRTPEPPKSHDFGYGPSKLAASTDACDLALPLRHDVPLALSNSRTESVKESDPARFSKKTAPSHRQPPP